MPQSPDTSASRRHDLDWLRVFAFGLLIAYHIGMLYVARWDFHFKSQYTSHWLENPMLLVNPWRMPILWLISGVATSYMLEKLSWPRFLALRSARLLLPLAFGLWVVVPPQLFVEMSADGSFSGGYMEFYRLFLKPDAPVFADYSSGIWPHVDVNHLWYLRELWLFTLLLIVCLPVLRWLRERRVMPWLLTPVAAPGVVIAPPLIVALLDLAFFPGIGEDGRREALGLTFFLLGFLIAHDGRVWQAMAQMRHAALMLGVATYGLFLAAYHLVWLNPAVEVAGLGQAGLTLLDNANRWFWLCAVFGYGYRCLNRPHPWLAYLSAGVFPFYIVHQTVILLLAFWLAPLRLGPVLEPAVIVVGTFAGCILAFEGARRIAPLRPFMGLKWQPSRVEVKSPDWAGIARGAIAALIILPLGLEILL